MLMYNSKYTAKFEFFHSKLKTSCYHHFDRNFWRNHSFKNSISFSLKSLTKKRIRRLVPFVLSWGGGNIIFEGVVPSKTSVKMMITTGLESQNCFGFGFFTRNKIEFLISQHRLRRLPVNQKLHFQCQKIQILQLRIIHKSFFHQATLM